jgi:hypothetical protein
MVGSTDLTGDTTLFTELLPGESRSVGSETIRVEKLLTVESPEDGGIVLP